MNAALRIAIAALAISATVRPGAAQDAGIRIEQQNPETGSAAEQVIAPQLSNPAEPPAPMSQITSERGDTGVGVQLSRGPRTAREPDPLSLPSEGRTGAVARVEGADRCVSEKIQERPALCDRVIEARAAEFSRPRAPVLSPEQRLLVDQRLREAGLVARAVNSRGMDPSEIDPNRLEGQALAAAVLERAAEREAAATQAAAPAAGLPEVPSALVEAILGTPGVPVRTPQ